MEVRGKDNNGITEVTVTGEIDLRTSPELRKVLVEATGTRRMEIVVDLGGVTYIDSSGLATLIECLQGVKRYGGKLKLVGLNDLVYSVFELARLNQVFEIERRGSAG